MKKISMGVKSVLIARKEEPYNQAVIFLSPDFWVIFCLVLVTGAVAYFFEWFWKVLPFAEKHPLVIWALVMLLFLGLAFVV